MIRSILPSTNQNYLKRAKMTQNINAKLRMKLDTDMKARETAPKSSPG